MKNQAIQAFKNQAQRLQQYLKSIPQQKTHPEGGGATLNNTQALEALSHAVYDRPWNTVRSMLDDGKGKPRAEQKVLGRQCDQTGAMLALSARQAPLGFKALSDITEGGRHYLDVAVPVEIWRLAENGIEGLNDFVSEAITGSVADLEDIHYQRCAPANADELAADPAYVFIRVVAQWCPQEDEDEEASLTDPEAGPMPEKLGN